MSNNSIKALISSDKKLNLTQKGIHILRKIKFYINYKQPEFRYAVFEFDGSYESAVVINWFKNITNSPVFKNTNIAYDLNNQKIVTNPYSPKYAVNKGENYIFDIKKNWIYSSRHILNSDIVHELLKVPPSYLSKKYKIFEFDESDIDYTADLNQFCTLLNI